MWNIVKASYLARGAGAAFGLLTLIPKFLPFETLDLLADAHYVIVKWNDFAGRVGMALAEPFGLAAIPHELITGLVIALSIGPFYALGMLKSEWGRHKGSIQNAALWMRAVGGFLAVLWAMPFLVSAPPDHILFWIGVISVAIPLWISLRILPAYRGGFIAAIGFVVTMEAVYLLGSKRVQDAFDDAVCEQEGSIAPRCLASAPLP